MRIFIALLGVAGSIACSSDTFGRLSREDILELQSQVRVLEESNREIQKSLAALKAQVQAIPTQDSTYPYNCVEISADTYSEMGKLWQVTGLRLISHPQGGELRGRLLSRLMVSRQNVTIQAQLAGERDWATGVVRSVPAGRYSDFSIVVRTKADLREISNVCLWIDERTGTTSAP